MQSSDRWMVRRFCALTSVAFLDMLPYILAHVWPVICPCNPGVCLYVSRMSCYSQIMIVMDHGFAIRNIWEAKSPGSEFVRSIVEESIFNCVPFCWFLTFLHLLDELS